MLCTSPFPLKTFSFATRLNIDELKYTHSINGRCEYTYFRYYRSFRGVKSTDSSFHLFSAYATALLTTHFFSS